jgi:hypothetical protein
LTHREEGVVAGQRQWNGLYLLAPILAGTVLSEPAGSRLRKNLSTSIERDDMPGRAKSQGVESRRVESRCLERHLGPPVVVSDVEVGGQHRFECRLSAAARRGWDLIAKAVISGS